MSDKKKAAESFAAPVRPKIRLTLHTDERFFGPGICELLEKIGETGSIQAACARMKMSYTKAWKILNRAEKEMGTELIIRVNGGKKGGSSTLTETGKRAVHDFREMEERLSKEAGKLFEKYRGSFTRGSSGPDDSSEGPGDDII